MTDKSEANREEAMAMKRHFWCSWVQGGDDYRPLTFPPNDAILGWWCTGYDGVRVPRLADHWFDADEISCRSCIRIAKAAWGMTLGVKPKKRRTK